MSITTTVAKREWELQRRLHMVLCNKEICGSLLFLIIMEEEERIHSSKEFV